MEEYFKRLLEDREKRYQEQLDLIEKYKFPIISFMLNIPGKEKNKDEYIKIHKLGIDLIEKKLKDKIIYSSYKNKDTGMYYLAAVNINGIDLKKQMIRLEETLVGRLFDIDVFNNNQEQITRSKLGYPSRKCILCNKDAKICIREENHTKEEIIEKIKEIIKDSSL